MKLSSSFRTVVSLNRYNFKAKVFLSFQEYNNTVFALFGIKDHKEVEFSVWIKNTEFKFSFGFLINILHIHLDPFSRAFYSQFLLHGLIPRQFLLRLTD